MDNTETTTTLPVKQRLNPLAVLQDEGIDFLELVRQANDGDVVALRDLRVCLHTHPELWHPLDAGIPSLKERWLTLAAGKDRPLGRLLLEGEIAAMRHNLLKAGTSQPERLLIDRICLCYLQVQAAERRYLARMEDGLSFKEAEFYGKRMERAQKQYLNAIKALEQVRKLQRPQVTQLNMATNQINVAQAVEGDAVPLPGGATIVEAIPQEHAALLTNRAQAWEEGID